MNSACFTRATRLLDSDDFQALFRAAQCKSSDDCFTLLARPNGLDTARLGLAISKQKIRRAVARNRVKRLVRESFRHHQVELRGLDIVVMARDTAVSTPNADLAAHLAKHWQRLVKRCATS